MSGYWLDEVLKYAAAVLLVIWAILFGCGMVAIALAIYAAFSKVGLLLAMVALIPFIFAVMFVKSQID